MRKREISIGEVLLKVNCLGICGSDMQIYKGLHKYMTLPVFRTRIVTYRCPAEAVRGFQTGDRVTMDPKITCGIVGRAFFRWQTQCVRIP